MRIEKRFLWRGLAKLPALCFLATLLFVAPASADWPLFRGDSLGSGVVHSKLADQLEVKWRYRIKEAGFIAGAVIADGTVFVGDDFLAFHAIDLKTGKKKWSQKSESGFSASPAVKDGAVYIGDLYGVFYCFDAETGKIRWKYKTESGAEINSGANFYKDNVLFGSQDSTLFCLDAKSGKVAWKFNIGDQIRCSPTIVGNRTFLAGCDSKLHVVNVETGKKIGDVEIGDQTGSTPAVYGDRVYFGTEGGSFFAVDWKTLKVDWRYRDRKRRLPYRSSAAVSDRFIIFGGRDKRIHAVDPNTGKEKWMFASRGPIDCSPVITKSHVYFGSGDGVFHVLDIDKGKSVWKFEAGGSFVASPAVDAGRIVIGSEDGVLYCFGAK